MKTIYQVRTRAGISFSVEAANYEEAKQRSSSPIISKHIAMMVQHAVAHVTTIEPLRGPKHLVEGPLFEDSFFNK